MGWAITMLTYCNRPFAHSRTHDQLSVNTKAVCFQKIQLARAERAYLNKVASKLSAVYKALPGGVPCHPSEF